MQGANGAIEGCVHEAFCLGIEGGYKRLPPGQQAQGKEPPVASFDSKRKSLMHTTFDCTIGPLHVFLESQSSDLLHAGFDRELTLHANLHLSNGLLYACLESQSSDLLHAGFNRALAMFTLASTGHISL